MSPFLSARRRPRPIVARGLSKAYGDKVVLRGLDLVVPEGQFLAIIGRSGCGKSTLLRLIAGLEAPDAGRLSVGPTNASPRESARVMFQEPRLLPWADVLANVAVGLGAERRSLRRARSRRRGSATGGPRRPRRRMARRAFGRAEAAGGVGPRARQPAAPAGAGRTARRARRAHPHRNAAAAGERLAAGALHRDPRHARRR